MNGKYIVREALDAVHNALEKKLIIDISIDWIKYIVHWSRSSPGWYAGVKIIKQGKWPKEAISSVCTLFPLTIIVMTLFHHTLLYQKILLQIIFYFEECECEFYMYMNALQGHQSDDRVLERAQLVYYEKKL